MWQQTWQQKFETYFLSRQNFFRSCENLVLFSRWPSDGFAAKLSSRDKKMFETFSADINSMFEFLNENSGSIQALSAVAMLYFTKKLVEVSNSQMDLIKKQQENDRAKLFFYIEGAGDNYIVTFFNTGSKAFILKSLFGDDRKMRFPTEIMSTKKYVSYYVFDPYSAYSFLISHNTKLIRLISPSGVEFKVDVKERFGERIDVPGFDSLPSDAL